MVSRSEVQKLSELRREQQRAQTQTNIVQGAIEEAQLITWPSPSKVRCVGARNRKLLLCRATSTQL